MQKDSSDWGHVVEEAARQFADLGVPDFVYDPVLLQDGSGGDDEISDGLLMVGTRGVILQSKAREPERFPLDSDDRVRQWTEKYAKRAVGQVKTTRRLLRKAGGVRMRSRKGFERLVKPTFEWPGVALVTHPRADGLALPQIDDTIYMTLRDWSILNNRLRSTANVVEYVYRALECGYHPLLGEEWARYQIIAEGDQAAAKKAGEKWTGRFPTEALRGEQEQQAQVVSGWIDSLYETVVENGTDESGDYLPALELLDQMPPTVRVSVGRNYLSGVADLLSESSDDDWAARRGGYLPPSEGAQVGTVFLSRLEASVRRLSRESSPDFFVGELASLVLCRSMDAQVAFGRSTPSIGVGEIFGGTGQKEFSYFVVLPEAPNVPASRKLGLWKEWGLWTPEKTTVVDSRQNLPGRNDPCICGSGKKSKHCHY